MKKIPLIERKLESCELARLEVDAWIETRLPEIVEELDEAVLAVDEVDELEAVVYFDGFGDGHDVVDAVDHFRLRGFAVLSDHVVAVGGERFDVLALAVLLLLQSFDVVVEGVDVTVRHHAVHGFVVVVSDGWIILENFVVELVEDSELQAVLDEEGHDILYADAVLHRLLGHVYGL